MAPEPEAGLRPADAADRVLAGLPDDAELIERDGKWVVETGGIITDPHETQESAARRLRRDDKI